MNANPTFDELIAGLALKRESSAGAMPLTDLTDDSRKVVAGGLFIARGVAGGATRESDAWCQWVSQACAAGAAAIIAPAKVDVPEGVALAVGRVVDQSLAADLAARFFNHPARQLKLIGITGTNGKTTVATMIQHLLKAADVPCGLLGTVAIDDGGKNGPQPAELTTPGAIELQRVFARMVANGCAAAVMEVSSHALDQGRVAGLAFKAAVFTNLTQDHLDYHKTMVAYAAAKATLFKRLEPHGTAVLNIDDPAALQMARIKGDFSTVFTSLESKDDAFAQPLTLTARTSHVRLQGPWGNIETTLPFIGRHNLMNTLQAVAAAHALAPRNETTWASHLAACPPVPGRLEAVGDANTNTPAVLVDYAHTPDALINVLATLRPLTTGRLICVFGCGGDRDRAKRPKMAQAAAKGADVLFLTSDNPRTEDPQQILNDTASGVPADRRAALTIEMDRAKAIAAAVAEATAHDTVLIAGKGHEDYQIVGTTKTHFDDREQAAAALAIWAGRV
ncbi:MAG: UDP-N-acetylmuramoyl-L-alanyl-D-glutamate--2,6-diaminopimelate ligase [Algisphaera sp.]